eukprot:g6628.t1
MNGGVDALDWATLRNVADYTRQHFPDSAHMMSNAAQGATLKFLADLSGARRVLELGSLTGYATIWLSLGDAVTEVVSVDRDPHMCAVTETFAAETTAGNRIRVVCATVDDFIDAWEGQVGARGDNHDGASSDAFDLIFMDADKRRSGDY